MTFTVTSTRQFGTDKQTVTVELDLEDEVISHCFVGAPTFESVEKLEQWVRAELEEQKRLAEDYDG